MSEIKFNNKTFDYVKLLKNINKGIRTDIEVAAISVKNTKKHVTNVGDIAEENEVAFYFYECVPVIILGLDLYTKALERGDSKINARMFTKHSLAAFEKEPVFTNNPRFSSHQASYNKKRQ